MGQKPRWVFILRKISNFLVNNSHVDGSKTNLKNNSTLSGSLISILQQLLNQGRSLLSKKDKF